MDPDAPDNMTALFSNCYPSWEQKKYAEGTLRRIAHTDFEVLTLLFQRPGSCQPAWPPVPAHVRTCDATAVTATACSLD